MSKKTICQKLGYKVGDKFIVTEKDFVLTGGFEKGQVVTLYEDNGTDSPFFEGVNFFLPLCQQRGVSGDFLNVKYIKPVKNKIRCSLKSYTVKKAIFVELGYLEDLVRSVYNFDYDLSHYALYRKRTPDHLNVEVYPDPDRELFENEYDIDGVMIDLCNKGHLIAGHYVVILDDF